MAGGATKPASNVSNCKFKKSEPNKQCEWYFRCLLKKETTKSLAFLWTL